MKRTLSKAILRKANMNSIKREHQRIHDLGMKRTLRHPAKLLNVKLIIRGYILLLPLYNTLVILVLNFSPSSPPRLPFHQASPKGSPWDGNL